MTGLLLQLVDTALLLCLDGLLLLLLRKELRGLAAEWRKFKATWRA